MEIKSPREIVSKPRIPPETRGWPSTLLGNIFFCSYISLFYILSLHFSLFASTQVVPLRISQKTGQGRFQQLIPVLCQYPPIHHTHHPTKKRRFQLLKSWRFTPLHLLIHAGRGQFILLLRRSTTSINRPRWQLLSLSPRRHISIRMPHSTSCNSRFLPRMSQMSQQQQQTRTPSKSWR